MRFFLVRLTQEVKIMGTNWGKPDLHDESIIREMEKIQKRRDLQIEPSFVLDIVPDGQHRTIGLEKLFKDWGIE